MLRPAVKPKHVAADRLGFLLPNGHLFHLIQGAVVSQGADRDQLATRHVGHKRGTADGARACR